MKYLIPVILLCSAIAFGQPKYHFLWVVDNSSSMVKQREILVRQFGRFLEKLREHGIKHYQMGVTTTDYFSYPGKLVMNQVIGDESANPVGEFSHVIESITESSTSFWEQGLESSFAVIQNEQKHFLKEGEPLVVIYISDEEDYSCKTNCWGVEPEHNDHWVPYELNRYIDYFNGLKRTKNINVSLFPIVGIPEGQCSVPSLGLRYTSVRAALQANIGVNLSVCENEVANSILSIPDKLGVPDLTHPKWNLNPIVLSSAMEDCAFSANLAPYVLGDQLVFSKVEGPNWLSMSANGILSGIPTLSNVGENAFVVRASNSLGAFEDTRVRILVEHVNHPPHWISTEVKWGDLKLGQPANLDLNTFVSNPDGNALNYLLLSAPSWISMSTSGILTGKPGTADLGEFKFEVRVFDHIHSFTEDAVVKGTVTK